MVRVPILEILNGSLIFFKIFFNCKSELRYWIKRSEKLRVSLQVSYRRVLKKKLSKQTTLKVIHVYGDNQTYRARISLSLSFSICITKTIFSIASLCDFREMRVWFLLLRRCRLCVSPQNSSR